MVKPWSHILITYAWFTLNVFEVYDGAVSSIEL